MTQEAIIKALKNGPLSSLQVSDITGMPRATVLSTAQNLRDQGIIKTGKVMVGKCWLAEYTLVKKDATGDDDGVKYFCGVPSYGIFSKAEYAVMKQQAARLYGKQGKKEITNNQFI
jgi:DNA-binding Lrp family transcriptional regulator